MLLKGKKVVVIGGSSGIGYSTAELAKAEGASVTIASRPGERLRSAAERLGVTAKEVDVSSDESVEQLFRACGTVDHVVLSAAHPYGGPIKKLSIADAKSFVESKFWGACRVARSAEITPGGSLTLVSGYFSIRPRSGTAIAAAVNGALESLTRALAIELAPVRVNAVSPGIIDTPLRAAMPEEARRSILEQAAAALPVKRTGTGEDVARQILAFASIGFATGSIVFLDGGGSIV